MSLESRLNRPKYLEYGGYNRFIEIMNSDLDYESKALEIARSYRVSIASGRNWMSLYKKTHMDGITR